MNVKYRYGMDSFSCSCTLTHKHARSIIDNMKTYKKFRIKSSDYETSHYNIASDYFADIGIKVSLKKHKGTPWTLYVIVHPWRVQASLYDVHNSLLYYSKPKAFFKDVIHKVNRCLDSFGVPLPVEDMKIYRADITVDFYFSPADMLDPYLKILKKAKILPHYKLDWFRADEHKAKDTKKANEHSYKQGCKSASFFVYDKTAQLQMIDKTPYYLEGKNVLRMEIQLRRKAIKKWVPKKLQELDDLYAVTMKLIEKSSQILHWYLKRMNLDIGSHYCYEEAVNKIEHVKKEKTRERMLYLLRKTSDSRNLSKAIEKTKEKFHLSSSQIDRVMKKFKDMKINPITIPNSAPKEWRGLMSLAELLDKAELIE